MKLTTLTTKTDSKLEFGAAKARRVCLVIALVLLPFLASEKAFAQVAIGSLAQTGTGRKTFTIDRGTTATFQLDLNITTSFNSIAMSYFLQTGANGSGLFSVTGRNTTGTPYGDLTTSDAVAFTPPNGLLDPVNNYDLGGFIFNVVCRSLQGITLLPRLASR